MLLYRPAPAAPATVRVRVQVTAEDIAAGVRCISGACVLAIAISRATGQPIASVGPKVFGAASGPWVVAFQHHFEEGPEFQLPAEAATFARQFDEGWTVQPFHFDLELPA